MPKQYYGSQTEQAVHNFPISGWQMPVSFIRTLAMIKEHAAVANGKLGVIPKGVASKIASSARQVKKGKYDEQFPVDVFQTGSGTSTNMNMNEVLSALSSSATSPIHPNDHVNACQSSNDVIPTAMQLSCIVQVRDQLLPALDHLIIALEQKGDRFHDVITSGRTHLMDAVPVRLGERFASYAALLLDAGDAVLHSVDRLCVLPLGGTAAGTGLNAHPKFASSVIAALRKETGLPLSESGHHSATQSCPLVAKALSGSLAEVGIVLTKIANDIRLMGSGPIAGFNELQLPSLQPGSSIMPGKVNPVLCESVEQVALWVMGADTMISQCIAQGSRFELHTCYPVLAYQLLTSIELLSNVSRVFADKCIQGILPNKKSIQDRLERNPMLITLLAKEIGYDLASEIVKESMQSGESILDVAHGVTGIRRTKLEKLLNPERMV